MIRKLAKIGFIRGRALATPSSTLLMREKIQRCDLDGTIQTGGKRRRSPRLLDDSLTNKLDDAGLLLTISALKSPGSLSKYYTVNG